MTEAGVDWDGLSGEVARQADALLGDEQAALILDESAFAKKGTASAGVARMWNGRLGKVDNSQVGVFSALCRDQRVTLLDTRLYLPKDWVEDAERCRRAHIFRKRPANCEANASLRWSWSIRPANTASDLATWPLTGATARIPPFSAAWRRVHCAFWPMSTSISGSGWMIPLPIDLPLRAVGVLHRSGAPTGPR